MTNSQSALYLLLEQLVETTEKILALPLDDDMSIETLEHLQLQQSVITRKIEGALTLTGQATPSVEIKQQVAKCLDLEGLVKQKMMSYQLEVVAHLKSITDGEKVRNSYQAAYSNTDGLYIDKQN
jgi:hypothetical protein